MHQRRGWRQAQQFGPDDDEWFGPCPLTGEGGASLRNSCSVRPGTKKPGTTVIWCIPCQEAAGVDKLGKIPGEPDVHFRALLGHAPGADPRRASSRPATINNLGVLDLIGVTVTAAVLAVPVAAAWGAGQVVRWLRSLGETDDGNGIADQPRRPATKPQRDYIAALAARHPNRAARVKRETGVDLTDPAAVRRLSVTTASSTIRHLNRRPFDDWFPYQGD